MASPVLIELGRDTAVTAEELALRRAGRGAAIVLDVDGLAQIRAALGMRSAIPLLASLERAITGCCRSDDAVHRVGSDRYLIVARQVTTRRAAQALAKRLLATVDGIELDGRPLCLSVGAGICFFPQDGAEPHEIVRRAEASAMAGPSSGQRISFYEEAVDSDREHPDALLGGELRQALEQRELFLVYQPKLSLLTGAPTGVEALMRWRSPTRGDVSPGRFVPLAERTGQIRALTDLALACAGTWARRWHARAPKDFRVSVNLSGIELQEPGRAARILEQLRRVRAPLERIELEVTESSLMSRPEHAREVLDELHAAGLQVAVDDFGTGYSSLAYLADLPVQVLKIDRKFVRELHRPNVRALLRAIVDLGHTLDLSIVAEGIETRDQLEVVRCLGIDVAQGFLLGRPGAPEAVSFTAHPTIPRLPHPARGLPERLPLLPAIAQELARLPRDRPISTASVERLAEADPALAVLVLQLAGDDRLRSLGEAIDQVGAGAVLDAVAASSTTRVFLPDATTRQIWLRAIRVACGAAARASEVGVPPAQAYVAGLLHDVGALVALACPERQPADPASIGAAWCRMLQLPQDLVLVVERHGAGDLADLEAPQRALIGVVRAAREQPSAAEESADVARRAGLGD